MKNSPAYGAWNGQQGTMGTGETLPGPVVCGITGATDLITGDPGKWELSREGVGGGRSTE